MSQSVRWTGARTREARKHTPGVDPLVGDSSVSAHLTEQSEPTDSCVWMERERVNPGDEASVEPQGSSPPRRAPFVEGCR